MKIIQDGRRDIRADSMGHHMESHRAIWDGSGNGGNGVWDRVGTAKEHPTTSGEE